MKAKVPLMFGMIPDTKLISYTVALTNKDVLLSVITGKSTFVAPPNKDLMSMVRKMKNMNRQKDIYQFKYFLLNFITFTFF